MDYLGTHYREGSGVGQDAQKAVEWFRKAADLGNTFAMVHLGECLESGQGIKKSRAEAIRWYKKAEAAGNSRARDRLQALGAEPL